MDKSIARFSKFSREFDKVNKSKRNSTECYHVSVLALTMWIVQSALSRGGITVDLDDRAFQRFY
jgi:hypothetical protein